MTKGVFISFEGSEGCGKSTQIELLTRRLRTMGYRVRNSREPGGQFAHRRAFGALRNLGEEVVGRMAAKNLRSCNSTAFTLM